EFRGVLFGSVPRMRNAVCASFGYSDLLAIGGVRECLTDALVLPVVQTQVAAERSGHRIRHPLYEQLTQPEQTVECIRCADELWTGGKVDLAALQRNGQGIFGANNAE